MKTIAIFISILMSSSLSFAGDTVDAATAATMVRQEGVEKCLSVVENNQTGVAQFDAITLVSTTLGEGFSTSIYKLEGSNLYGDIMAGSWEISVEVNSSEVGQMYSCQIIKNEE